MTALVLTLAIIRPTDPLGGSSVSPPQSTAPAADRSHGETQSPSNADLQSGVADGHVLLDLAGRCNASTVGNTMMWRGTVDHYTVVGGGDREGIGLPDYLHLRHAEVSQSPRPVTAFVVCVMHVWCTRGHRYTDSEVTQKIFCSRWC